MIIEIQNISLVGKVETVLLHLTLEFEFLTYGLEKPKWMKILHGVLHSMQWINICKC
jgi:hypothetical protein